MEAPEKINISIVPSAVGGYTYITCSKEFPHAVEYVRADAFLKKASEWLRYNNDLIDGDVDDYVESFINYMKEKGE